MNIALVFIRLFFFIVSIFFMTTYTVSLFTGSVAIAVLLGIVIGSVFGLALIGFDLIFRRFNLRFFNILILGLFIGFLMGKALVLIFDSVLVLSSLPVMLHVQVIELIKIAIFLFGIYLGTITTLRWSDELYISIPFVKFTTDVHKKRDLIIDASVLADPRIIDLATSGILDSQLVLPRFVIKDLYLQAEAVDENLKNKAKRCLEATKKLEEISTLDMRYNDTDFPEVSDQKQKLIRLARLLDANVLTSDLGGVQTVGVEDVRFISFQTLSKALRAPMQTGEKIKIKIQRFGKEPRQGVGYLEDGTMVVVNGGGDYIGEIIDVIVLSVKHTASGRMIFCNTLSEESVLPPTEDKNEY